jgi:glycosyltransferase 2 family protein
VRQTGYSRTAWVALAVTAEASGTSIYAERTAPSRLDAAYLAAWANLGPVGFTELMQREEALDRIRAVGVATLASRRGRVVAQVVLVAALIFVLLRLRSIWHDSRLDVGDVDWALLVAAVAVSVAGMIASALVWLAILRNLGVPTRRWYVAIFLQAQLAKYIPGSVWQYAGRATLARAYGMPLRRVMLSLPVELVASSLAGGSVSLLLLGSWGVLGAAAALFALSALGVAPVAARLARALPDGPRGRELASMILAGARAVWPFALTLGAFGFGFWLTARALYAVPVGDLFMYIGAFVAAWLAGLLAVYAPSGLGVRETVIVAVLHRKLGTSDALVLAAVSRALLTFVDLLAAAFGFVVARRNSHRNPPRPAALPDPNSQSPV